MKLKKPIASVQKNLKKKYLKDKKYRKVRDHFYYTGEYSGAEHTTWNLKYSLPKKII